MRRILIACTGQVRQFARSAGDAWNTFWFAPSSPSVLGLIRILTGSMLVYTHVVWGLNLHDFFGPDGWLSAEAVALHQAEQTVFSFWWLVPAGGIGWAHATALLVLVLFTVGLFTRFTSIASFLVVASYANRAPIALFGLDQINAMLTLYLAIGPSGQALSLDRLIARWRAIRRALDSGETSVSFEVPKSSRANLALRLIQVHLCVIYFFAGISKLQGPAWWNGEAMWLAFANLEYQSADMTWLAWYPWLSELMTHTTVAWEISFCVLAWKPALRPLVLSMAVVLHVGIGACLGMWTFGLAMLIACCSFLPERCLSVMANTLLPGRTLHAEPVMLLYRGESARSRRLACWRKALDVRDRLRLVNRRALDRCDEGPPHRPEPASPPDRLPAEAGVEHGRQSFRESLPQRCTCGAAIEAANVSPDRNATEPIVLCLGKVSKMQKVLWNYLPRRGYHLLAATDVRQGLLLLESNPPDCVLLLSSSLKEHELQQYREQILESLPAPAASVTLLLKKQSDWAAHLENSDCNRVVVEPISLRALRGEIAGALRAGEREQVAAGV